MKPIPTRDVYSLYQAREKIYPREVTGVFQRLRFWVISAIWLAYYGLAWVPWGDRQAVLFDLPARQFHIFGFTFWPQDFFLLTWLLIIGALSLFMVTAIAGRIWCGYTCPQTVWTEAFLWIERKLEGNYRRRQRRDQGPWSYDKIWRKTAKHFLWIAFALWTGFTFVGYFTPIRELAQGLLTCSLGGWEWFWFLFYSVATYGNAGFLREQVCQYMCPYARFQGAMLDRDTVTVTYDAARGEPRRGQDDNPGDCINCNICVQVCPTGIDIRDGAQYECIGCAACIDACDQVMARVDKPLGLIGYASERQIQEEGQARQSDTLAPRALRFWQRLRRPRILLYGLVWIFLVSGFLVFVTFRAPVAVDIVRDRTSFYQVSEPGFIDNVYTLRLMNKQQKPVSLSLKVLDYPQASLLLTEKILDSVPPFAVIDLPLRLRLPQIDNNGLPERVYFEVTEIHSGRTVVEGTLFWRPKQQLPNKKPGQEVRHDDGKN